VVFLLKSRKVCVLIKPACLLKALILNILEVYLRHTSRFLGISPSEQKVGYPLQTKSRNPIKGFGFSRFSKYYLYLEITAFTASISASCTSAFPTKAFIIGSSIVPTVHKCPILTKFFCPCLSSLALAC